MTESQWKPIETAPNDGRHILLFWNGEQEIGWYNQIKGKWDSWEDVCGCPAAHEEDYPDPTHWMPLPTPPKGDKE